MSLGWYCSLRMGEGKRNLWSQSPVRTSHCDTMLSVEALTSLWPSRLQLHTHKCVTVGLSFLHSWSKLPCSCLMITTYLSFPVKCISPQRTHWVDVCADNFGNASCEKVPDHDAAIVAAHGQQRTPAVECAGEGHADAVQSAICLLTTHIHKHNQDRHNKAAREPAASLQDYRNSDMGLLPKTNAHMWGGHYMHNYWVFF